MRKQSICVLGGTGFLGTHLVSRLSGERHPVRVLTRRREQHRDLLVLPTVELIEADVHDERALTHHFAGQDTVINLVGILNEHGDRGRGFHEAHVELAQKVVNAAQASGVRRLLHMSALHADPDGPSHYLRSKGKAEALVLAAAGPDFHVTCFRPSVIFGPDDRFLNRFAQLLQATPWVFPLACAKARFAPIYVGDVATTFTLALDNPHTYAQSYDLCGPRVYTLRELVASVAALRGVRRTIIGLGPLLSRLQAEALEHLPGKPFSRDNFRSLQIDSVCDGPFPEVFKFTPTTLETVAPRYLTVWRGNHDRYTTIRRQAHRP